MTFPEAASAILIASTAIAIGGLFLAKHQYNQSRAELESSAIFNLEQERKRTQVTEDRWQALLIAVQDPVLLVTSDGRCEIANTAAEQLFPGAAGSLLLKLSQSSELSSFVRLTSARPADELASIEEFVLHHPNERTVQAVGFPAGNGYTIVILRDLTELRRLERVRRDFVANVSHELRTPLSSVKAMAETLIDGAISDSEVAIHFLETIVHESDRLVRISADLLDLSRIESQPAEKSMRDLSQLILDVVAGYGAQIKAAGHQVIVEIEQPLLIEVDPDEISQVMVNLVDNAIKYTPNSGTLTIWSELHDDFVKISVSDTGIGILQQDLSRLFERFYRTDKARSRASGGTGLGLSIVKHIVERHGGTVGVESEYNHGSTFSFTLPR